MVEITHSKGTDPSMNKNWFKCSKYLSCLTAVIFLITALSGCTSGQTDSSDSVTVAMNIPLTGDLSTYGQSIRDGALLAMDSLQSTGPEVSLEIGDNGSNANKAVSVFQKQMRSKPDIYTSGVKPQTMSIFERVTENGLPHFVWIFDAFVAERDSSVFRTWVNYKYEVEKYIEYIESKDIKKVSAAVVNFPHTREEFFDILKPRLDKIGVDLEIEVYDANTNNYRNIALKMRKDEPSLYILNGFQGNIVGLVRSMRNYNMINDGNTIATFDLLDAANVLSASQLEGIRGIVPEFSIISNKRLKNWEERFENKHGRDPLYTDAYSYDMMMIINDTARRIDMPATNEEWASKIVETEMNGITGPIEFDDSGDLIPNLMIGVYRDGNIIPAEIVSDTALARAD